MLTAYRDVNRFIFVHDLHLVAGRHPRGAAHGDLMLGPVMVCAAFQKLPNGNWNVVKAVKIENGKASVMLKPARQLHPVRSERAQRGD